MLEASGQNPVVPIDHLRADVPAEAVRVIEKMTAR
jgi:hypothetical protein